MTPRIFNLGVSRVVMGHGVIENAPCVFLHEGFGEDPTAEPTEGEVAALTRNGVVLRLVNLEGALSLLNMLNASVEHLHQQMLAAEAEPEAELLDEPVFISKRKRGTGYDK
jgi:hypothetical protein